MSAVIAAASRKITAESAEQASFEERAMLFRSYADTYRLTDDGVIHHVEVVSDPSWIGKDQTGLVHSISSRGKDAPRQAAGSFTIVFQHLKRYFEPKHHGSI